MLLLPVLILDPCCGLVDLREECALVDAKIFERLSNMDLLTLRNNERCFVNRVWKIHFLRWIYAVEDEGTGLCQNSPVAHFGLNIIRLK